VEEVRLLIPHLLELPFLKEEIQAYRQAETQLSAQRKQLRDTMTGEPVTAEAWEQSLLAAEPGGRGSVLPMKPCSHECGRFRIVR
jgi:hypothetical protein